MAFVVLVTVSMLYCIGPVGPRRACKRDNFEYISLHPVSSLARNNVVGSIVLSFWHLHGLWLVGHALSGWHLNVSHWQLRACYSCITDRLQFCYHGDIRRWVGRGPLNLLDIHEFLWIVHCFGLIFWLVQIRLVSLLVLHLNKICARICYANYWDWEHTILGGRTKNINNY